MDIIDWSQGSVGYHSELGSDQHLIAPWFKLKKVNRFGKHQGREGKSEASCQTDRLQLPCILQN